MILNHKRLSIIVLTFAVMIPPSFVIAELTTLNHFDPAPISQEYNLQCCQLLPRADISTVV